MKFKILLAPRLRLLKHKSKFRSHSQVVSRITIVHLEVDLCANSENYARRRPSLHHFQQKLSDPTRMRLSMTMEA
jgi:hypothetical protein